jgi:putative methanogenesis marker protein 7
VILEPITYKGGLYRYEEIVELIEDLGGYIIQLQQVAGDVIILALVPKEDLDLIRAIAKPISGEVKVSPLVGTEIAVVSMSLEIHHLPHATCDVAEYLRQFGAKTNVIGLARGFGKRIAQLNVEERDVINEHDCAILLYGNFEECIRHKNPKISRGITVPIIVTGAPDKEALMRCIDPPVDGYVGGMGRLAHRAKRPEEIAKLEEMVREVSRVLDLRRAEIYKDPLSVAPPRLMDLILEKVEAIHEVTSPTPVTVQMGGLRVKLPYESYANPLRGLELEQGVRLGDIADVLPSRMRTYTWVRVRPFSETKVMV